MVAPARVRIAVRPSRVLTGVLGFAHAVALAIALIVALPLWAKLLLGAAIAASCGWSIYRSALLLHGDAIVELEVGEGGDASLRTRDDAWRKGQVQGTSLVLAWLTVLNVRPDGERRVRHVAILPDNVDADAFRTLRVLLRWSKLAADRSGLPKETLH
jgi:toxin CptA